MLRELHLDRGAAGLESTALSSKHSFSGIAMVLFSAFGGILFGYDTGTISGILRMDDWLKTFGEPVRGMRGTDVEFALTTALESIVVSILFIGTIVGAVAGGPTGDALGRRIGIMVGCVVFSLGIALQTGAPTLPAFIVGRFFAGSGLGLVSALVPVYQSECAPKRTRGAIVGTYQWAITIGILVASVVNNATKNRTNHSAWRLPISLQFIWASILFAGMFTLPETPRWLMKKERRYAAAQSLARLRGVDESHPGVQLELDQISTSLNEEIAMGQTTYRDCFRSSPNKIALRTLTSIFVLSLKQLAGVVFIGSYGVTFFANVGLKNPFLVSVVVNVVQMGMTLPGIWGVERLGRRPLLFWGGVVMSVCAYLIAILDVTTSVHDIAPQRAVIALVCVFYAAYASTWGPVAWVIPSEIVPLNVRAKVVSLSVAVHWLCTWLVSFVSPYLANSGPGDAALGAKIFFIWGSTTAVCALFAFFCVPETKGLPLEQIDLLYQHSTPLTSARYGRKLLASQEDASIPEEGSTDFEIGVKGDPDEKEKDGAIGETADGVEYLR